MLVTTSLVVSKHHTAGVPLGAMVICCGEVLGFMAVVPISWMTRAAHSIVNRFAAAYSR